MRTAQTHVFTAGIVCFAIGAAIAGPRPAATLISEFSDLLKGKTARIVWQKDEAGWPGMGETSANTLMKLDTRDGVVKTFVTGRGYMARPTFTWDGEKVVFTDLNTGTVYAANWSDGGVTTVAAGYENGGCWQSGGKNWIICNTRSANGVGTGGAEIWRISVETPVEKVKMATTPTTWPSISVDGTHISAMFPDFGAVGILTVQSGSLLKFSGSNVDGSCWPTISRDNNYNTLFTVEPHQNFVILGPTGNLVKNQKVQKLSATEYNIMRWTMDPDIFTFMVDDEDVANPYVERISDGKYVYINNPATGSEGNVDVYIESGTTGTGTGLAHSAAAGWKNSRTRSRFVDVRGRLVRNEGPARCGVVLESSASGVIAVRRLALR